ncbi:succinyl-CoA:3-ketoacid CoA transferase [Skeletonema marinoi]|uniref:Succinyl-CoA:3-ketoacid CoA transferase n=2 Tax=Skeletonema marinoi TaxID=267567 RepID=A0AAD8YEN0_9STRA|nr:succinyl-CoA:3-ketoacid CoA transferase [Skeletonema marinoi]
MASSSLLKSGSRYFLRRSADRSRCGGLIGSSAPSPQHGRGIASLSLCNATNSDCKADTIDTNGYNLLHGYQYHISSPVTVNRRSIHHHISVPSKLCKDASTALQLSGLKSGDTIAVGGFGVGGIPETLLNTLSAWENGPSDLTVASLTAGVDGFGLGKLFECGKVKRMIASYVGENKNFERMFFTGELEVELVPQGTIAARLRAAGAGMPAIFTPAGAGTMYANGGLPLKHAPDGSVTLHTQPRPTQMFDGKEYVMEYALRPDVSFVKAYKADTRGNLVFHHLIHAADNEKRIERLRETTAGKVMDISGGRGRIVKRAAKEFRDGMYVNLGIGIPTMASSFIPEGMHIELQAENGLMGLGPYPDPSLGQTADPDYINAGKETVTAVPGASTFHSSESFNMIRGGHMDLTILGGMQCSSSGDLASFFIPGKLLKGMGGAMDLVSSPSTVVVTMEHTAKGGAHKILEECTLPLTGKGVVDRIITDMCVFDCDKRGLKNGGLTLIEIAQGITVDDVRAATSCSFDVVEGDIPLMEEP